MARGLKYLPPRRSWAQVWGRIWPALSSSSVCCHCPYCTAVVEIELVMVTSLQQSMSVGCFGRRSCFELQCFLQYREIFTCEKGAGNRIREKTSKGSELGGARAFRFGGTRAGCHCWGGRHPVRPQEAARDWEEPREDCEKLSAGSQRVRVRSESCCNRVDSNRISEDRGSPNFGRSSSSSYPDHYIDSIREGQCVTFVFVVKKSVKYRK